MVLHTHMTDETEVIESVHVYSPNTTTSDGKPSPLYDETDVDSSDRTVRFWNKATFSDTSIGKTRRVRFGIKIGTESIAFGGWDYYASPKEPAVYNPDDEINVPRTGETQHFYDVLTHFEIEEMEDGDWTSVHSSHVGPIGATVNDSDPNPQ